MSNANVTFAPGQRIGNYELLLEIASGGTATVGVAVYRGAVGFERLVVIKRVHRQLTRDPEFTAMLTDEARLSGSIRHPNVVPVTDVVRVDDEIVLVMDYVDSVTLSQLGKDAAKAGRRLPMPVVSRILVDTLQGLHEAHEAVDIRRQPLGIVHRDVSPQNVLVGDDGVARVIDFGIAKARSRVARTRAGIIKGKCAYMAPEQVDGQAVDRRCDVFAAGIVLWEQLTGARLFRGDDEFDEMRRVMRAPIPPPSSVAPGCGPTIDALLAHALARPVGERFQTALAFARALEQAIPPAPAHAVAEQVEALCGTELDYRHSRLAAILGDEMDKLSPRTPKHSVRTKPVAAPPSHQPTVRMDAAPRAPSPAPVSPATAPPNLSTSTLRSSDGAPPSTPMPASVAGVEADVLEPAGVPKRSMVPLAIGAALLSLVVGGAGAYAWLRREPATTAPASSATQAATPVPSASATTSSVPTVAATSASAAPPAATSARPSPSHAAPTSTPRPAASGLKTNPYGN
jgi:serine/threonine-protein kinase